MKALAKHCRHYGAICNRGSSALAWLVSGMEVKVQRDGPSFTYNQMHMFDCAERKHKANFRGSTTARNVQMRVKINLFKTV